jgi:uncharacterized protein YndB with AHSA1/START domain
MPYVATIPVVFPYTRDKVYEALCDISLYPLWNSGMKSVSGEERLREGLRYTTESVVAGHVNVSEVEVVRLVPNEEIELVSKSGLVAYRAVFTTYELTSKSTEVVCTLRFEFRNFVLDVARPVIEAMAQSRVRGDLEMLRALLTEPGHQVDGGSDDGGAKKIG